MERKMTRIEAATRLGVTPQTITNWVKRGLLAGCSDKKSRRFYVNGDDVDRHAEQYKLLSVSEESLKARIKEFHDKEQEVDVNLHNLLNDCFTIPKSDNGDVKRVVIALYLNLSNRSERSTSVMTDFINGCSMSHVADKHFLSIERVRQIIIKNLRLFIDDMNAVLPALRENKTLKEETAALKEEVKSLKEKLSATLYEKDQIKKNILSSTIFSARLENFNLSIRSLNIMRRNKVETIGDLVQYTMSDLLKMRNLGNKSLGELDELVQSLGLRWGMSDAKTLAKDVQQGQEDAIFNEILAKLYNKMEKKCSLSFGEAVSRTFAMMARFVDRMRRENELDKLKSEQE